MQIVALDGYTLNPGDNPWDAVAALGELIVYDRTGPGEVESRAADAAIVLTNKTPLNRAVLERLPRLQFISVLATGYNCVDVRAARERGITVSNVPVYGTDSVAQHVWASVLHWRHRIHEHDAAIRGGAWARSGDFSFWLAPWHELAGQTMGIVGLGRIGRRVASIADAFGMRIVASGPRRREHPDWSGFRWVEMDELFSTADVISLHCPQTEENREFVDRRLLSLCRPETLLINTARGTLIREQDLADALRAGRPGGAILDVASIEPLPADSPLLAAPNCLLTPHMAWSAVEARRRLMEQTTRNIAAFLAGQPVNVVNH